MEDIVSQNNVDPDSTETVSLAGKTVITEEVEEAFFMAVPQRLRKLSSLEFYHTAVQIRTSIIRLTHSQAIPKSLRGAFTNPMCETARDMINYIIQADHFYPTTEEHVQFRKDCYAQAEACVDTLSQDLQTLFNYQKKYQITKVNVNSILEILQLCDSETKLLKSVRKNVKLKG